jgi:hypothetical protein
MFASWTWQQAGMDLYFPYSGTFQTWGRNHGLLTSKSHIKPGDIVLYGTSYYDSHHSGVVVDVNPANGYITTVEGNYGNQVTMAGPFSPYSTGPVHTYDNIYAVVSPVSDGLKDWNTGSGVESASNFGESPNDDVCTGVYRGGGIKYQLCLQALTSTPTGTYGAYRTTKFRGRLAVHHDRRSGDPSRSAVQTTTNLHVPGSGSEKATCVSSLLADNVKRTCFTDWISVGSRGMTSLTAQVTVDGSDRTKLRAGSLPMYGYKQETSTYAVPPW